MILSIVDRRSCFLNVISCQPSATQLKRSVPWQKVTTAGGEKAKSYTPVVPSLTPRIHQKKPPVRCTEATKRPRQIGWINADHLNADATGCEIEKKPLLRLIFPWIFLGFHCGPTSQARRAFTFANGSTYTGEWLGLVRHGYGQQASSRSTGVHVRDATVVTYGYGTKLIHRFELSFPTLLNFKHFVFSNLELGCWHLVQLDKPPAAA